MKENNAFALVLLFSIVACGGTIIYPSASETITTWRTVLSTTTYTSTSTRFSNSYFSTVSFSTVFYTHLSPLTNTYSNYPVEVAQEKAAHYPTMALIIRLSVPPEIPRDLNNRIAVIFHYRSPKNMTFEHIGSDTWEDMRSSTKSMFFYRPWDTVNINEGTGSWWDSGWYTSLINTEIVYVYITSGYDGFPEILSVDLEHIVNDAVTKTDTFTNTKTFLTHTVITELHERTYTSIGAYITFTFETLTLSSTRTSEATFTPSTTYPPTTTLTLTPTQTPSAISGIDMLGILPIVVGVVAVVIGIGLLIRRRRKAEAPHVPPTPPPI